MLVRQIPTYQSYKENTVNDHVLKIVMTVLLSLAVRN